MTACVRCGHDPDEVVAGSWTFVVDRNLSSMNARIVNNRASAHVYRRERDAWCWEFRAIRLREKIPKATTRRRVALTRIYSGRARELDHDNFVGGAKLCVDAMVLEGLIAGDQPSLVDVTYRQERGDRSGLRIVLEQIGTTT